MPKSGRGEPSLALEIGQSPGKTFVPAQFPGNTVAFAGVTKPEAANLVCAPESTKEFL